MNHGLKSIGLAGGHFASSIYRSKPVTIVSKHQLYEIANPFGVPVMAQMVLICISAEGGFEVGDQWNYLFIVNNSTVNTVSGGFISDSGQVVGVTNGNGGNGVSLDAWRINGSVGYLPANTYQYSLNLVGPVLPDRPDLARLPQARRFTTRRRPAASSVLYSEPNPFAEAPAIIWPKARCTVAELGYSEGDEIDLCSFQGPTSYRPVIRSNRRLVDYRTPTADDWICPHKTTGVISTMTLANWQVYLEVIG